MKRRALSLEDETPRPPCATCGGPATCVLQVEIRDLHLERDSGTRSAPYWTPSWKSVRTHVTVRLCQKCTAENVKVRAAVTAEVDQ